MPGALDLDFMRVKRKTRSHPTSPKGSPTRNNQNSSQNSQACTETRKTSIPETGKEARKLRKRSDDGRYLFLAKSSEAQNQEILVHKISSSTPSSPVCVSQTDLAEDLQQQQQPGRSKSVRAFVELLASPATSDNSQKLLDSLSSPKKSPKTKNEKELGDILSQRRVSRVCVILNDAELLLVSKYKSSCK